MAKFLVQEIYEIEAADLTDAQSQASTGAKANSVVHVSDRLEGMFNPVHLADAQDKFSHIQPAPAAEE